MKNLLTLEEVAVKFDLSKASVNYYTNLGLIVVDRKKGNKRFYDSEDVTKRINKIRDMMNIGYTLRLIQREFALSEEVAVILANHPYPV